MDLFCEKICKALNPLLRIQVILIGPSQTTRRMNELDFFFSSELKNEKKILWNDIATTLMSVKFSLSCCVPQCLYLWNGNI